MNKNGTIYEKFRLKINMRLYHLILSITLISCQNSDKESIPIENTNGDKSSNILKKGIDSISDYVHTFEEKENSSNKVKKEFEREIILSRFMDGLSDANLNGKPIVIQLDLPQFILASKPDTIDLFINRYYHSLKSSFPVSIADDFERGISTEHIHYPTLKFSVQLFENENSKNPYKIIQRIILNQDDASKQEHKIEETVHDRADQMPTLVGNRQDVRSYLLENMSIPTKVKLNNINGISWLTLIVEKDGSISNIGLEKSFEACTECDEEVLHVAKSLPKLNPGTINKEPVRVRIRQGIQFE